MRISGTGLVICGNGAHGRACQKSMNGCSGRGFRDMHSTNSTVRISKTPIATSLAGPGRRLSLMSGSFPVRGWWRSARGPRCSSGFFRHFFEATVSYDLVGDCWSRPSGRGPVQPSVMFLVVESAVIGAFLTLLGLVIEGLIVRSRSVSAPARAVALPASRAGTDSSLKRSPDVGSDDSTAIRLRVPSTVDFVAVPPASPSVGDEPRAELAKRLTEKTPPLRRV